jgi:hypothetical protein
MPRWQLPFAPVSIPCELPVVIDIQLQESPVTKTEAVFSPTKPIQSIRSINTEPSPINNLMGDILDVKKTIKPISQPISAADILAQLNTKPVAIDAFSLSIWRPVDGVMIVDSRNTKLALPTELLLNNILRSIFSNQALKPQEEVLRWPMIENSFAKRTASDARIELQTWLSVQHEIRPIHYLWLMGANSASYFLPDNAAYNDSVFKVVGLADSAIKALILPSLNELLKMPTLKQQLFSAIHNYQLVT